MKSTERKKASVGDAKKTMIATLVSTTLRLVIPVMGLFLSGLVVDALRGQPAFFAIIGMVLGFAVAAKLIYMQIKSLDTPLTKAVFDADKYDADKTADKTKTETDIQQTTSLKTKSPGSSHSNSPTANHRKQSHRSKTGARE
ncbi:MAG: hypothetical protein WAW91_01205 [Candidatus Nanoperiomorbaceae bacterium]